MRTARTSRNWRACSGGRRTHEEHMPRNPQRHVSVSAATYARMAAHRAHTGMTLTAILEMALGYLPRPADADEPREVLDVSPGLYARGRQVARRTGETTEAAIERAIARALDDAATWVERPGKAKRRPMVAHASRRAS